jgi:chromosomal replication initiation ATPase DnaA
MSNVVTLSDSVARARAIKARLWNPPNARQSSEIEVVAGSDLQKRRKLIARQEEEARQAEADFQRHKLLDDLIRVQIAEHTRAKEIAQKLIEEEPMPMHVSVGKILVTVSAHYGVSMIEMRSHRRTAQVVRPRQIAMYLAREYTLRSLPDIGRRIGGRDHTTVLHAHRKIKYLLEDGDDELAAEIANIKWELGIQ